MLRTYADEKTGRLGITRAQWTVLARLDRFEGLKQSELALKCSTCNRSR
jgi:MarR family transcriptional regulator for hemolysin